MEPKRRKQLPAPQGERPWAHLQVWYKGKARKMVDGLGLAGIRPAGHRGVGLDRTGGGAERSVLGGGAGLCGLPVQSTTAQADRLGPTVMLTVRGGRGGHQGTAG